jgi:DNA-binding Xre family transcriptional regulator
MKYMVLFELIKVVYFLGKNLDKQIIDDLIKILEQETELYNEILNISKNKTSTIVEGKVAELESMVKLEQSILVKMGKMETAREQIIEKISAQLDIKPSDVTLTELYKHIGDQESQALGKYQTKMSAIVNEVKNSNELNSKLIKNSLDYINFSINLLTEVNSSGNSYGLDGNVSDSKKRNIFDVKL